MTLQLTQASDSAQIGERQYGTAAVVGFTHISSCIVVAFPVGGQVIAIHLAMMNEDSSWFEASDVPTVMGVLQAAGYQTAGGLVFGQTTMWEDTQPVATGYAALIQALGNPTVEDLNDGNYGAQLNPQGQVTAFTLMTTDERDPPADRTRASDSAK